MACSWPAVRRNGSAVPQRLDELARRGQRPSDVVLTLAPPAGKADLEHEQLLEREPAPRRSRLVERPRPVHRVQRVALDRQLEAWAELGRQRIGHGAVRAASAWSTSARSRCGVSSSPAG